MEPENNPKPTLKRRILREVLAWTWVILAFLVITGTIGQARVIPSGSMERTLLVGDHLLMSRLGYDAEVPFTGWHMRLWREPRRQEIVIFRAPVPGSPDFVKRLIGLPGDTLEIRDGAVWVNSRKISEPYLDEPMPRDEHYGPVTVPPRHYFVMGDNREQSWDSRSWGFVPREALIGTPVVIYMSIAAPEPTWDPGHIPDRIAAYGRAIVHPGIVRWKRLFSTF